MISYVITKERITSPVIEDAVMQAMIRLDGAYSLILINEEKLIAARDKYGFRPLCYGRTNSGTYIVASESCALNAVDAHFIRDLDPGEIVVFDRYGVHSIREHCNKVKAYPVLFEYIFLATADSVIDVAPSGRQACAGEFLARSPVAADIVSGFPDSGMTEIVIQNAPESLMGLAL